MAGQGFPKVNQVKLANFAITMILVVGFVAFEAFNAATTYQGFDYLFKNAMYASMLALAVICVDIGGLSRILTPQQGREEPAIIKVLTMTWLFVAFVNALLTWYVIEVSFETSPPAVPSALAPYVQFIPPLLAALVLAVHCSMIFSLGIYLDVTLHGGRRLGSPLEHALKQTRPTTSIAPRPEPLYRAAQPQATIQKPWPEKQAVRPIPPSRDED